ncbi:hypothetical protein Anas_06442, partial [Armadillidium nasatum]
VVTWQRRAANLSLHLFPIPSSPLALPFTSNSNPLRSPIVIPLTMDALTPSDDCSFPFEEFDTSTRHTRMHLFQETILEKFGFLYFGSESHESLKTSFVHVTGNMIVLISNQETEKYLKMRKTVTKSSVSAQVCLIIIFIII